MCEGMQYLFTRERCVGSFVRCWDGVGECHSLLKCRGRWREDRWLGQRVVIMLGRLHR